MDEVNWNTSVMIPIWAKVKLYLSFRSGYKAGMTDWIMSFSRWQVPMVNRMA